jgi:predicted N-acetyltransferase YhbS
MAAHFAILLYNHIMINPNPHSPISIRRGLPADLPQLADLVHHSFAEYGEKVSQISQYLPHLFTPARAGDYFIAEMDGRMVATIGLYPYLLRVGQVVFRTAGVGQVSTLPEARGKGAMSSLLRAVCQEADRYDFTWLYGDRLRYGRYGWTAGGWTYRFETGRRYLPPPPEGGVEAFDPERHLHRLQAAMARLPQSVVMPDEELRLSLHGQSAQGLSGAFFGRSFVIGRDGGEVVLAGDGDPDELGALLAYLATGRQQIHVDCAPQPSALLKTCLAHYKWFQVCPSASFRVGNLGSFLRKAAALAGDFSAPFQGELGLVNTGNDQKASLICREGKVSVGDEAGQAAYNLSHQRLSEVCFGLLPLSLLLPGLPEDSPFRQVLPVKIFISELFAL